MADDDKSSLEKLQDEFGGEDFPDLLGVGADEEAEVLQLYNALKIVNGVGSINLDSLDASDDEKADIIAKTLMPSEAMANLIYYFVKASLPPPAESEDESAD